MALDCQCYTVLHNVVPLLILHTQRECTARLTSFGITHDRFVFQKRDALSRTGDEPLHLRLKHKYKSSLNRFDELIITVKINLKNSMLNVKLCTLYVSLHKRFNPFIYFQSYHSMIFYDKRLDSLNAN